MFHHSITVSYRFVLLFYQLIFKNILMYRSSAEFWGWFCLKGKSYKTFDIVASTKVSFCKFWFWEFRGSFEATARQPPAPLRAPLTCHCVDVSFSSFIIILLLFWLFVLFFERFVSINLAQNLHVHKGFESSNFEIRQCIFWLPNVLYCNVCHSYCACLVKWRPYHL
jgi:hypothetical protein